MKKRAWDIEVSDFRNFHLEIYTIGFPTKGESIVSLLKDGTQVKYAFCVDAYYPDGSNGLEQIAKITGVTKINRFIWTHPDEDHSVGINRLLDRFDSNHEADIILPAGIHKGLRLCESAKESMDYIRKYYNYNREYTKVKSVIYNPDFDCPRTSLVVKEQISDNIVVCSFTIFAPHGAVVNRFDFVASPYFNDISVSFEFKCNSFGFLYTGDMMNKTIELLDDYEFHNTQFVKIPHHGSKSSGKLIRKLKEQDGIHALSVSTVNGNDKLPEEDILKGYMDVSEKVYVTGPGAEEYGIVKMDYCLYDASRCVDCKGNVMEYVLNNKEEVG